MNKREALTSPRSCLNKAAADEPVFVLRARDPLAPQAIRHWATMASGGLHEPDKVQRALDEADEMEKWHAQNVPTTAQEATRPGPAPYLGRG